MDSAILQIKMKRPGRTTALCKCDIKPPHEGHICPSRYTVGFGGGGVLMPESSIGIGGGGAGGIPAEAPGTGEGCD